MKPIADIVVPCYQNPSEVLRLLQALANQSQLNFILHLCIDSKPEEILKVLSNDEPLFQLLIHTHNQGEHKGRQATRNLAFSHLKSENILFLDSDLIPSEDWVSKMTSYLNQHPIVISNLVFTNASDDTWADYYLTRGRFSQLNEQQCKTEIIYVPVDYVSQAIGFKRSVLNAIGPMDESIQAYGGDIEYSQRIKEFGFNRLLFLPRCNVFGYQEKSLLKVYYQHKELGEVTLPYVIAKYPNAVISNYTYLMRLAHWIPFRSQTLNHLAEYGLIPLIQKPSQISRFLIRVLLTMAIITGIKKNLAD